jgi:hypothetical protein
MKTLVAVRLGILLLTQQVLVVAAEPGDPVGQTVDNPLVIL